MKYNIMFKIKEQNEIITLNTLKKLFRKVTSRQVI